MSILDDLPDVFLDAFGDNVFYDATLTRSGTSTGDAWNPTAGAGLSWKCKGLSVDYSTYDRASGLVRASDRKVLILAASLATSPQVGDQVSVNGGLPLTIVSDNEGAPGVSADPSTSVWTLRCRL